jgi:hypothetical protein
MSESRSFADFVGCTILAVRSDSEEISFDTDRGTWVMNHAQDCCESVGVEDVTGELSDLVGGMVVLAEERTSGDPPEGVEACGYGSETWTFYTIRTTRGDVDIRWCGSSNGYYSESVDFFHQDSGRYGIYKPTPVVEVLPEEKGPSPARLKRVATLSTMRGVIHELARVELADPEHIPGLHEDFIRLDGDVTRIMRKLSGMSDWS